MPLMTIAFDPRFQHLNVNTIDEVTGHIARIDSFQFADDKEVQWRTLFDSKEREVEPFIMLAQFGSKERLFHLFVNLIRELSRCVENTEFDPREASDWLIEEPGFNLELAWPDLIKGLQIVESSLAEFNETPDIETKWRVNLDDYIHSAPISHQVPIGLLNMQVLQ